MSLGGSIFTHNVVKFDYCVEEAIASLCELCDEVVVLDASSDDDLTLDVLKECVKRHANMRLIEGAQWECADNYDRLAILATQAKSLLKTKWHFMLQADEVIHEDSFPFIREAIKHPTHESYFCRRLNLFGDTNHYLRFDLPQDRKPCSDVIIRLAHTKFPAVGDAESLGVSSNTISSKYTENIHVYHYGLVRRDQKMIEKVIDMQGWFFGKGGTPDQRVVGMKDGIFDWTLLKEHSDLAPIFKPHPKFSKAWAEERQLEKTIIPKVQ